MLIIKSYLLDGDPPETINTLANSKSWKIHCIRICILKQSHLSLNITATYTGWPKKSKPLSSHH